jgi:PPP family 3-phenylpropionic acid transporter
MSNFIWILISAMTLVAISCAIAPNQEVKEEGGVQKSKPWTIIVTKPFIIFIISAGLIQISHSVLYGFGTLHWRNLGHSETTIGLFWSIGVLAEIALFALAGKERIGPLTLLTAAALAGVIRWLLLAMLENHVALFVTQILHCFTFGAAHLGAMTFLSKTIPNDVFATGQGIYYTLVGGVFSGCMLPVAGFLFTSMAGNAFYFMAILSAFALGGLYLLSRCSYQNLETEH